MIKRFKPFKRTFKRLTESEGGLFKRHKRFVVVFEDYGIARAYRDTGIPVKLPVYGTGRIPVQERHCGTSEMLVPVEIDLENSTVPVPIPVPVERILLHPP